MGHEKRRVGDNGGEESKAVIDLVCSTEFRDCSKFDCWSYFLMAARYSVGWVGSGENVLFLSTDGKLKIVPGLEQPNPAGTKPKRVQSGCSLYHTDLHTVQSHGCS